MSATTRASFVLLRSFSRAQHSKSSSFRSVQVQQGKLAPKVSTVLNFTQNQAQRCAVRSRRSLVCKAEAEDATAEAPPPPPTEGPDYDRLDIRVGKILKAWKHPDADGLYVEEVEVGEEEPRTICSGLVNFVPEEEMQERSVIVLCNLKPRNMRGIKSNGMLLCASDEAHENVEMLTPPEGAVPGERVKFGDYSQPQMLPDTPNRLQKKKVWEGQQPGLNTSEEMIVRFEDKEMMTSAGVVTVASLKSAGVS
ncbi:hypothetical protein CYMTET_32319 [Cymbomonas tetramitiformis]|uniref:tRNA-binding domain-containing protein n=1 Tax=Cymbomonas tetramitiformis TaxID=36881 RepID=A0AAE0FFN7_9CHLO|nr:hypothetical protein CYMTET_32319 [Cymbomonas tetramitiformis]